MTNVVNFPRPVVRGDASRRAAVLAQDLDQALLQGDDAAVLDGLERVMQMASDHGNAGMAASLLHDASAPCVVRVRAGWHVLRDVVAGTPASARTLVAA